MFFFCCFEHRHSIAVLAVQAKLANIFIIIKNESRQKHMFTVHRGHEPHCTGFGSKSVFLNF